MPLYIRTVRWLDRCLSAHARDDEQSVFPIVQGGLNENLRKKCADELLKRNVRGYAVGGLRLIDDSYLFQYIYFKLTLFFWLL